MQWSLYIYSCTCVLASFERKINARIITPPLPNTAEHAPPTSIAAMSKEEKLRESGGDGKKEGGEAVGECCLFVDRMGGSFTDSFLQRIEKLKEQKKITLFTRSLTACNCG